MRRLFWIALVAVSPLTLAGCGGSGEEQPTAQTPAAEKQASPADTGKGPDVAVFDFLKAVQTGDKDKAAAMLTNLARQKTAELEMEVAPPGSETASFEVGAVEMIQDSGAYVSSTWTDLDEAGQPHSDQIVWVLRKEPEGWRIAGMVTKLFDNKLVLNFEDPEDMVRKQELAAQEMVKRSQQQAAGQAPSEQTQTPEAQAQQPVTGQTLK